MSIQTNVRSTRTRYFVNSEKWIDSFNGRQNYRMFSSLRAANRYFLAHPERTQIDVSGVDRSGRKIKQCLKHKLRSGQVITQEIKPIGFDRSRERFL